MPLLCRLTAAMVAVTILEVSGPPFANAQPAPSADPALAAAIEDLVAASRILADQGVVDAYGHVSIRHPSNPNHYLMSRSLAPAQVTTADIMEFDLDSNPFTSSHSIRYHVSTVAARGAHCRVPVAWGPDLGDPGYSDCK